MPYYAIVIDDPALAHAADIARNVTANMEVQGAQRPGMSVDEETRLTMVVEQAVRERTGPLKTAGELHGHMPDACPDGLVNCRNCGDPNFAESCQAAGHCPHCGTRHGIAPQGYLSATGLALVEIEPPADGHEWDPLTRLFVKG